jgi:hypothetical protein
MVAAQELHTDHHENAIQDHLRTTLDGHHQLAFVLRYKKQ